MTPITELLRQSTQAEQDALLTLRQVANLTDTRLETLRRWCRDDENLLPHIHVGPTKRIRVRWCVVVQFFPHVTSTSI